MNAAYHVAHTDYRKKRTLLDIAICETLFSTGMRISELCNLKSSDIDLHDATIRIYGKGSKERMIQIGNNDVLKILVNYEKKYISEINQTGYFFVNPNAHRISDQSIRRMIKKYCSSGVTTAHILLKVYILKGSEYNSPFSHSSTVGGRVPANVNIGTTFFQN